MKLPFNSPNRSKVRERGLSLSKDLNNFIFFSFRVRCDPNAPDFSPVRLYIPGSKSSCASIHSLLQVFIFGTYCSRIVGDGVVAVSMCYMLYRRSSGLGFMRQ